MQSKGEAKLTSVEALGALSLKTTVVASGVSIEAMSAYQALRTETTPAGGLAMRW